MFLKTLWEVEKILITSFSLFPTMFSVDVFLIRGLRKSSRKNCQGLLTMNFQLNQMEALDRQHIFKTSLYKNSGSH